MTQDKNLAPDCQCTQMQGSRKRTGYKNQYAMNCRDCGKEHIFDDDEIYEIEDCGDE